MLQSNFHNFRNSCLFDFYICSVASTRERTSIILFKSFKGWIGCTGCIGFKSRIGCLGFTDCKGQPTSNLNKAHLNKKAKKNRKTTGGFAYCDLGSCNNSMNIINFHNFFKVNLAVLQPATHKVSLVHQSFITICYSLAQMDHIERISLLLKMGLF